MLGISPTIALEAPGSLQGVLVDRSRLHNQTDIAAIGDRRNIFYRIFPKDENIRGGLLGYLPKVSGLIQHLGIDLCRRERPYHFVPDDGTAAGHYQHRCTFKTVRKLTEAEKEAVAKAHNNNLRQTVVHVDITV